jgi:hypothetical protein
LTCAQVKPRSVHSDVVLLDAALLHEPHHQRNGLVVHDDRVVGNEVPTR